MGRNIKHYNGYYKAQTSNQWDSTSTGYTVPSGKVARIGFKLASSGGAQSAPSGDSKAIGGFFAGTNGAGTTSTGHNTNRFLLVYTPGADKDQSETNFTQNIDYNENNGHRWSLTASDTNHTPRLYIGDHMRERYTNRSNSQYMYNNFGIAN